MCSVLGSLVVELLSRVTPPRDQQNSTNAANHSRLCDSLFSLAKIGFWVDWGDDLWNLQSQIEDFTDDHKLEGLDEVVSAGGGVLVTESGVQESGDDDLYNKRNCQERNRRVQSWNVRRCQLLHFLEP